MTELILQQTVVILGAQTLLRKARGRKWLFAEKTRTPVKDSAAICPKQRSWRCWTHSRTFWPSLESGRRQLCLRPCCSSDSPLPPEQRRSRLRRQQLLPGSKSEHPFLSKCRVGPATASSQPPEVSNAYKPQGSSWKSGTDLLQKVL